MRDIFDDRHKHAVKLMCLLDDWSKVAFHMQFLYTSFIKFGIKLNPSGNWGRKVKWGGLLNSDSTFWNVNHVDCAEEEDGVDDTKEGGCFVSRSHTIDSLNGGLQARQCIDIHMQNCRMKEGKLRELEWKVSGKLHKTFLSLMISFFLPSLMPSLFALVHQQ